MKMILTCLVGLVLSLSSGCSLLSQPVTTETITDESRNLTAMALSNSHIKPYRQQICDTVDKVSIAVAKMNDPQTTLNNITATVDAVIQNNQMLSKDEKAIVSMVVNNVIDSVYNKVMNQAGSAKAKSVLDVAQAVCSGMASACVNTPQVSRPHK